MLLAVDAEGEEINMAVCQAACWGEQTLWQSVLCQQSTLPEVKGPRRPEGRDGPVSILCTLW